MKNDIFLDLVILVIISHKKKAEAKGVGFVVKL